MKYIPRPIDTSDVQLPPELEPLAEQIARNVHEVWAKGRLDDGWTYGPERSESLRTHSCLVPYDELTEEEKDYAALGMLRWFVDEQVEEEENAADIIASLEQVGGDKLGMFMIDKELASRTYSAPSILSQKD